VKYDSNSIRVVDSHTAGEPTRVVIEGGPDLGNGTLAERLEVFKTKFDQFRRTVILEPRGYEAMVGALLCEPDESDCETAILFFNNEGFLNMCGHGTIGVVATLCHLGQAQQGICKFQTPAGKISVEILDANHASFTNVPSFVLPQKVELDLGQYGMVEGEIAYGGNWFFIARPPVDLVRENLDELLELAAIIREEIEATEIAGLSGGRVDHVQFFEADFERKNSRNFVVCPGGEFDRSPCGTGTSAVLACLAASGRLSEGDTWTQESLTEGKFSGSFRIDKADSNRVIPTISGAAFVCAESTLIQHVDDPYRFGNEIKVHAAKMQNVKVDA
jgi:4-hydroxyproline epimerase